MALNGASMPNKTLIITVLNKAYVEQIVNADQTTMLDLFLESFWLGDGTRSLLEHVLFFALDQTAYDRCKFERLHCYKLVTEGVDFGGEKVFMSNDYIKLTWRKTQLFLDVLKRGYNFIFTDADIVWLRNPFAKLSPNQTVDLQISVDSFTGDPRPEHNFINTGFFYIRSNNKTISMLETWYAQKENSSRRNDQQVLQDLMKGGLFNKLGLQARFLKTRHFSGFCQDSQDVTVVTTVHANCCRHIKAKFGDLSTVLRDWKLFKAAVTQHPENAGNITRDFKWSPHSKCQKSWMER
ncbi:hypothetical protein PTKIN_Ptkin15bG0011000 [Pterospermum kingtungense]